MDMGFDRPISLGKSTDQRTRGRERERIVEEILNPAKCIDCGEIYELDGLDLDLRCEDCVEQWEIDELEGKE